MNPDCPERTLGITVLGDFILSEGVEAVVANVLNAGANAVACNPTVTNAADEDTGSFQPPLDAGSSPRVFDRPLFGKHALWVRSGPSYHPNPEFYRDGAYAPRSVNELTDQHGAVIQQFIKEAKRNGLRVYFQLGAAQPSGLRDDDRPRLPDGSLPQNRMADTGSLASPAIRAYNRAYVRDLLAEYPQVDGFRIDWPEYPCYTFGELFQDFGPHVADWCRNHAFEFEAIRSDVLRLWEYLHGRLSNEDLSDFSGVDRGLFAMVSALRSRPEISEWLRLKAALSVDIIRDWRALLTDIGGSELELTAHAFMPHYSLLTGFDFRGAAAHCQQVAPKLYTMHWSQMVEFWGRALLERNPHVDERLIVGSILSLMDLCDPHDSRNLLSEFGYPAPDEPHPLDDEPQLRKIQQAVRQTRRGGSANVCPLVHGYGPLDDFDRRLRLVADSDVDGLWINRYGYLSDDKLDIVRRVSQQWSEQSMTG
ncbi:MAG: hypothetical protein ABGZ17_27470 [Planctomycetaceae bacterium]